MKYFKNLCWRANAEIKMKRVEFRERVKGFVTNFKKNKKNQRIYMYSYIITKPFLYDKSMHMHNNVILSTQQMSV